MNKEELQSVIEHITTLLQGTPFTWHDVETKVETMVSNYCTDMKQTSLQRKEQYKDSIVSRFKELQQETINGKHYSATAISVIIADEQGKTQQAIQKVLKERKVAFLGNGK